MNEKPEVLGKQITAVYKRLFNDTNIRLPLILNGSVILNSKIFKKALGKYLESKLDNLDIQPIKGDPSFGASETPTTLVGFLNTLTSKILSQSLELLQHI